MIKYLIDLLNFIWYSNIWMKLILKILIIYFVTINASFAYLDPGSGSVILQAIIGFIAAIFATLSFYWGKFKLFILKLFKKEKKTEKE